MAARQYELSLPAAEPDLMFGRYRLVERLGTGGSADVWLARDERLARLVAIKRLHRFLLPDDASRQRFVAEARSAAGLSHPGIVRVYDIVAAGDEAAIVFELVDGESLAVRLARDGQMTPPMALAIAGDIADALGYAHRQGVLHCDVKPANVLIDRAGRARLVDFGIAQALERTDSATDGMVVGTLRYMAPEQLRDGQLSPAVDVYALGLVLHEMLAGRPAFSATDPRAIAAAHLVGSPPLEGGDEELARLVAAMTSFDPEARPADASALASRLRALARRVGAGAAAALLDVGPGQTPAIEAATTTIRPPVDGSPAGSRGRYGRRIGLVAAGIGLVAVAALVALGGGQPPRASPSGVEAAGEASPSATPAAVPSPTIAPAPTAQPNDEPRGKDGEEKKGDDRDGKNKGKGERDD
jgi:serine/threonine-protein kinase